MQNNLSFSTSNNLAKNAGSQGNNPTNYNNFSPDISKTSDKEKIDKLENEVNTETSISVKSQRNRPPTEEIINTYQNGVHEKIERDELVNQDDQLSNPLKRSVMDNQSTNYGFDNQMIEKFMNLIDEALAINVPQNWIEVLSEAKKKIEPEYKRRKLQ